MRAPGLSLQCPVEGTVVGGFGEAGAWLACKPLTDLAAAVPHRPSRRAAEDGRRTNLAYQVRAGALPEASWVFSHASELIDLIILRRKVPSMPAPPPREGLPKHSRPHTYHCLIIAEGEQTACSAPKRAGRLTGAQAHRKSGGMAKRPDHTGGERTISPFLCRQLPRAGSPAGKDGLHGDLVATHTQL